MSPSGSPTRVAAGYKAAIHNPNFSEETKERAQERLDNLEAKSLDSRSHDHDVLTAGKNEGNVMGGYKATLKNPHASDEAKQNAKEILEEHDAM